MRLPFDRIRFDMTDKASRPQDVAPPTRASSRLSALHLAPDSLAFALDGAALQSVTASGKLAAARGAIQDIASRAMRRLALADALLHKLVKKAAAPHVANVLACAFALLTDDEAHAAYAPFTVVDQAVNAIAARREFAFAKGLVNAVLRNFLRERDALIDAARESEVARWNYPQWWIDAVRRGQPDAWERILEAGNGHGPLTLRVNARHANVDDYSRA